MCTAFVNRSARPAKRQIELVTSVDWQEGEALERCRSVCGLGDDDNGCTTDNE